MTYIHDAVIRAWLDGKTIQFKHRNLWLDIENAATRMEVPQFHVCEAYRIKPEKIKARFFKFNSGLRGIVYSDEDSMLRDVKGYIERQQGTWVGDWFDTPFDGE